MSRNIILGFLLLALFSRQQAFGWGFYSHRLINKMAVFTLPPEMLVFYKQHVNYLAEHAVDPDKRRYVVAEEAPRHYIDLEYYLAHNTKEQVDSIPWSYKTAKAIYSEDSLMVWGTLPWAVEQTFYKLVTALKELNKDQILRYSADIGHYIADMQVPLHTTANHNGQLTGQEGIHGLWESRVPELSAANYNFVVGKAIYLKQPREFYWESIWRSFKEKDEVLLQEHKVAVRLGLDKQYSPKQQGKTVKRSYSQEYIVAYEKALNGMVEEKMRKSVLAVGSIWYTAWVKAGQPALESLCEK